MVASKSIPNNKRRGGFNGGMPNRQRFKPGGKQLNARAMGAMMFNTNQLGDNPGFVDFNDDVQIPAPAATTPAESAGNSSGSEVVASGSSDAGPGNKGPNKGPNNRKGNPNQRRQNMKNGGGGGHGMRRMPPGMMNGHWGPPMPPMYPMGNMRRNGPMPPIPPPHFRVPPMGMRGMRGGPMMPPPPPNGRFHGGGGGGPPMGPMMRGPMPPMPPQMRGGPMMGGGPMGRMMPPSHRNRLEGGPPMRRGNPNGKLPPGGGGPGRVGKAKAGGPRNAGGGAPNKGPPTKPNGNPNGAKKNSAKSKPPVRPREEYPLDKPWVTDEIRGEHDKKVQLADRLKGNRDDALFAQFKEQRDTFVKMYDAARLEFIGKHPEQDVDKILTESVAGKNAKPDQANKQSSNDAVSTDTSAATTDTTTTASAAAAAGAGADASASSQ